MSIIYTISRCGSWRVEKTNKSFTVSIKTFLLEINILVIYVIIILYSTRECTTYIIRIDDKQQCIDDGRAGRGVLCKARIMHEKRAHVLKSFILRAEKKNNRRKKCTYINLMNRELDARFFHWNNQLVFTVELRRYAYLLYCRYARQVFRPAGVLYRL